MINNNVKDKPLFSVLIANYNNGRFIVDAVESVIKQTYQNWEIIIVDDRSTDNSIEIISNLIKAESRIKLFKNDKNRGCGYTKRRCAEFATGEICGILDPDDALVENAIELSVKTHLANPNISLLFSNCYICDPSLNIRSIKVIKKVPVNKTLLESISEKDVSGFHFASFKRSMYNQTTGIDPFCLRAVDQDLYYKLEEVGSLFHIDDILYKYRVHEGGLSLGNSTAKAISWHCYVIIETCKRRGLKFEDYIPMLIERDIVNELKKRKDYRIGFRILKPLRFIKKLFP